MAALAKEIQECETIDAAKVIFSALSTAVNETAIEIERFSTEMTG